MKKIVVVGLPALLFLGILIQLIPYGHDHINPPVRSEPTWNSLQTRALAKRACFDCHSDETKWHWYSDIAPVSWLIYHDVTTGRTHINFSDWTRLQPQHVDEFQKVFNQNSMPPANYLLLHPSARLIPAERQQLFDGLGVLAAKYRH